MEDFELTRFDRIEIDYFIEFIKMWTSNKYSINDIALYFKINEIIARRNAKRLVLIVKTFYNKIKDKEDK